MMDRHPMYSREAIVVGKMKNNDVEDQRGMGGFYLVFWPEIKGNGILPVFELLIELTNCIQQLAIGLFRGFGRV